MRVRPLPGVNPDNLRGAFVRVANEACEVQGTGGTVIERRTAYIRWANNAIRMLSAVVSSDDVDRLVRTRAFWALQTMDPGNALTALLSTELDERAKVLEATRDAIMRQIEQWSRPGYFVVADTSFYIQHPDKIGDLCIADVINVREDPIHLLVPIIVIDELDGLKQAGDKHVRWRARHTLQGLDGLFATSTGPVRFRAEDFSLLQRSGIPRGEVSIEIVFDPPGHLRLPINDDEIIDRTLAIQALAGRSVILLTYDTGQSTRGRAAGLRVTKLQQPPGGEPVPKT